MKAINNIRHMFADMLYKIWYSLAHGDREKELRMIANLLDRNKNVWTIGDYRITLFFDSADLLLGPILKICNTKGNKHIIYHKKSQNLIVKNVYINNNIYILLSENSDSQKSYGIVRLNTLVNPVNDNLFVEEIIIDQAKMKFHYDNADWDVNELQSVSEDGNIVLLNCLPSPVSPYSANTTFKFHVDTLKFEMVRP